MLEGLSEVVTKLAEFSEQFQQAGEKRRERIANYFSNIAECLRNTAEKLKNGEVPSREWGELKIYAEELQKTVGEEIGQEQANQLSNLLKITVNNTPISNIASGFKNEGKYSEEIEGIKEISGRFNGLVNTVRTKNRLKWRTASSNKRRFFNKKLLIIPAVGLGILAVVVGGIDWWLTSRSYTTCSDLPSYRTFDIDLPFYRQLVIGSQKELGRSCVGSYVGNTSQSADKLRTAIFAFEKAGKLNPDDPQVHFFLGHTRELLVSSSGKEPEYAGADQQYKDAIRLYQEQIRPYGGSGINKQDFEILVELGHFLTTHQRDDEASEFYKQVLTKDPNNTGALLGICVTHFHLNERVKLETEVLPACDKAIQNLENDRSKEGGRRARLEKNLAEAYYDKGCVQVRLGDYSNATDSFNEGSLREIPETDRYLDSAKFFSLLLDTKYSEAIAFFTQSNLLGEHSHEDEGGEEHEHEEKEINQKGSFYFGLGIANFALGNYGEASNNLRNATQTELTKYYLSEAQRCEESNICQRWTQEEDPKVIAEMHNRFSAFLVHYYKLDSLLINPHHHHNENYSRSCTLVNR